MIKKLTLISFVLSLMFTFGGSAFAQERTGSVEGKVTDSQNAVIPNVTVTITGESLNRSTQTDENGFFRFPALLPGRYSVEVAAAGFGTARRDNDVDVTLGNTTQVPVTLQAGPVGGEVTITTQDVAPIDIRDSKVATNIDSAAIELLPKSPNFSSLLAVSPSVRNEPSAGGFQVDGASGSENTFIIDGQEVTNFRTGTLNENNNIPTQFVQEIQIKTSGFEAEFGGATGGVINVVTKSGGNRFTGEVGVQFDPGPLQARPELIQEANPARLRYLQPPRINGTNLYPSFTVQGPIVKNRLWFFTSSAPQFLERRRNFTFRDGSQTIYDERERRDYSFLRLDSQITDQLRVYSTYTYNPIRQNGLYPGTTLLDAVAPNATQTAALRAPGRDAQLEQGGRTASTNFSIAGTYTPTSRLVIDTRYGRGYLNERLAGGYGVPNEVRFRCITGAPNGACNAGFSNIPNNFANNKDISIRKTFDLNASYLLSGLIGRHLFKGGYQLNDISNDADQGYVSTGEIRLFFGQTFPNVAGVQRGNAAGESGYGYLQRFGTFGQASSRNEGLFIQDSWTPVERLTINLGFRVERENVPAFNAASGGLPLKFGFGDKFAPRLGFAYDVLGNGKLKIFGSFGRFYDRFKYELPRGSFGGDTFLRDYFVISTANQNPFSYTRAFALSNAFRQNNFRVPSNDPTFTTIDPDLKAVRQTEFTFGGEYSLTNEIVLKARYLRKKLDRTIEDVGIPDAQGNETYFIANPGFGIVNQIPNLIPGVPATPKAQRQYDAFELAVNKRFSNNYYLNVSYTRSRLFGNYGGLANSDENGRTSPNVNRVFDLPFESFTASGVPNNGRLATDRPNVFKFFGGYDLTYKNFFGLNGTGNTTRFSLAQQIQSGTPVTSRVDLIDVATVVLNERGDLGRTKQFTQTDAFVSHTYKFGGDERFGFAFDVNVINLFNQKNELRRYELISQAIFAEGTPGFPAARNDAIRAIFRTGGLRQQIQNNLGTPEYLVDARFNRPDLFQTGRRIRLGLRLLF